MSTIEVKFLKKTKKTFLQQSYEILFTGNILF